MRPSILADTIRARAEAHFAGQLVRPMYITGSPGGGKTQLTAAVAASLSTPDREVGFRTLHTPLMQPEDFGMPKFDANGEITFSTPGHLFPFVDSPNTPEYGLLVFEELGQADLPQQKIIANLKQERELHGRKLKPGWYIVSTGNRQQDRAGSNRVLSHLSDRITTYELETSLDDWKAWAMTHDVKAEVIAFLNWRSDLLSKFDPSQDKSPTPRGWAEGVSMAIGTVPREAEFDTFKGDVGEGAASEFLGFIQTYRDLPDPDLVLANPDTADIPDKVNVIYALCGALAHRVTKDNAANFIRFGERLHRAEKTEFMMLMVRDAVQMCPGFDQTRAFVDWTCGIGGEVIGRSGR